MEWEIVRPKEDMVRRMAVPGGWLYQVQKGRDYIGHPSNDRWEASYYPPYFVPGVSDVPLAERWNKACPCLHTTPCHDRCSCIEPFSSSGCQRCCTYGSDEQRRIKAEHLVLNEKICAAALKRHKAGDFKRTMPTSGRSLIVLLDKLLGASQSK